MIPAGFVLYASDESEASITQAREYIRREGLTADDVKLIKVDQQVRVVAKLELWK